MSFRKTKIIFLWTFVLHNVHILAEYQFSMRAVLVELQNGDLIRMSKLQRLSSCCITIDCLNVLNKAIKEMVSFEIWMTQFNQKLYKFSWTVYTFNWCLANKINERFYCMTIQNQLCLVGSDLLINKIFFFEPFKVLYKTKRKWNV